MKKIKLTTQAQNELITYKLCENPQYMQEVNAILSIAEKRKEKFNSYINKNIPNKNMIKALRMMPALNTPQDWARLHVTEALMRMK